MNLLILIGILGTGAMLAGIVSRFGYTDDTED